MISERMKSLTAMTFVVLVHVGLLILAAGCHTTGPSRGGDFCDVSSPIRPSPEVLKKMTEREIDEALAHNTFGAKRCGWKAQ